MNGAGKTTLIRILTTMLQPTSGTSRVLGINPMKEPEKVRSLIGVLPQETGLYEEFSINENLYFIGKMQGLAKKDLKERIQKVCELMGLEDRLDNKVNTLSGGLKQRAMIARTLIGSPKILFLDEPTTGLDVLVARKVRQIIKSLSKDMECSNDFIDYSKVATRAATAIIGNKTGHWTVRGERELIFKIIRDNWLDEWSRKNYINSDTYNYASANLRYFKSFRHKSNERTRKGKITYRGSSTRDGFI
ncbi:MAG: Daunorubicin/doxorubicin resistance ATP-binding protein DrrA [Candidatus Heimdallarchaeota archaeon LC_2]|nr:MAG: Daunorubicin/doxorubicin resistance ATP-binding protein DrrA [Candidatus Heimdallarchaeota archaeon LC_2]